MIILFKECPGLVKLPDWPIRPETERAANVGNLRFSLALGALPYAAAILRANCLGFHSVMRRYSPEHDSEGLPTIR